MLVGTGVCVLVAVAVGVLVGTGVCVLVAVAVGVLVGAGVCVLVAVAVGVSVEVGVALGDGAGVFVGAGVSVGFVIELDGVALATFDIGLLPLSFTALIRNRYSTSLNKPCGRVA